jgi:hypothetical protein
VPGLEECGALVAAVDDRGGYHVATTCYVGDWTEIRYSSSNDAQSWTTRAFRPPDSRFDENPQLAFEGDTLDLAFTRQAPTDGGCGDDGLADVGAFYRTRTLPSGDWSSPHRIGPPEDHLQSFRIRDGVIHATVASDDETLTWYERIAAGDPERVRIADALGAVALRIGDDGVARLAYESSKGIRFASVQGGTVSASTIPHSAGGFDPVFVLGPSNLAYVLWIHTDHSGGCAELGPAPEDGTFFATNAGGNWSSIRLTRAVGESSLTLDPATGDVLALVTTEETTDGSMTAYRRTAGGDWSKEEISDGRVSNGVLRVNPVTSAQFVAYVAWSENGKSTVRIRTRS